MHFTTKRGGNKHGRCALGQRTVSWKKISRQRVNSEVKHKAFCWAREPWIAIIRFRWLFCLLRLQGHFQMCASQTDSQRRKLSQIAYQKWAAVSELTWWGGQTKLEFWLIQRHTLASWNFSMLKLFCFVRGRQQKRKNCTEKSIIRLRRGCSNLREVLIKVDVAEAWIEISHDGVVSGIVNSINSAGLSGAQFRASILIATLDDYLSMEADCSINSRLMRASEARMSQEDEVFTILIPSEFSLWMFFSFDNKGGKSHQLCDGNSSRSTLFFRLSPSYSISGLSLRNMYMSTTWEQQLT